MQNGELVAVVATNTPKWDYDISCANFKFGTYYHQPFLPLIFYQTSRGYSN